MEDQAIKEYRAASEKLIATAEALLASVIAPPQPVAAPLVGTGSWLGAATKLQREIFALSQQPGVPECVRKHCDEARESLHHAKVDMQFEAEPAPNAPVRDGESRSL